MNTILELIEIELKQAFENKNYDSKKIFASISNRPDLAEFQCSSPLALAKQYNKKPIDIASEIADELMKMESEFLESFYGTKNMFEEVFATMPGFINIKLSKTYLRSYLEYMVLNEKFGLKQEKDKSVVLDFGGANVAKPLHVGHLRSAVIGESIQRILRYAGNTLTSDVHLGDWGLQMGLIIEELRDTKPNLIYFDETYEGEYKEEAPFDIDELEKIYPRASLKSKFTEGASEEEKERAIKFKERAMEATLKLQNSYKPYVAIWKHILDVSIKDLKKNYDRLNTSFDLWKGESDAKDYIPILIDDLIKKGLAYESEGALVVDISEEGDSTEKPPALIRKSDGAALYVTSDLGTIMEREKLYNPDEYIYVTDIRQSLHFEQVFRVAKKAELVAKDKKFIHIGFGTVNGKDGKPFKTRDGGVMRLENLIDEVCAMVYKKIKENRDINDEEAREISEIVGLAALKYADLSNQAAKDYIFDMEKFTSFEGNTGPYILYTIVRIKSILKKYYKEDKEKIDISFLKEAKTKEEKDLVLEIANFNENIRLAYKELAPYKICQYVYSLANKFNSFYHNVNILNTKDEVEQKSYIALIQLSKDILETCIDLLAIKSPEYM